MPDLEEFQNLHNPDGGYRDSVLEARAEAYALLSPTAKEKTTKEELFIAPLVRQALVLDHSKTLGTDLPVPPDRQPEGMFVVSEPGFLMNEVKHYLSTLSNEERTNLINRIIHDGGIESDPAASSVDPKQHFSVARFEMDEEKKNILGITFTPEDKYVLNSSRPFAYLPLD